MKFGITQGITFLILVTIVVAQFSISQPVRAACAGVVYVDADSTAITPTGCNWALAYPTLQDALEDPLLVGGNEIWVAEGIYYPDDGLAAPPSDIRESTFRLHVSIDGIKIYGGFDGTETALEQRDPATNVTVLSGDIYATPGNTLDNAYRVVTISPQVTSATVLDGFTISGGNTEGDGHFGGGVYIINASPTLTNLIITENQSPTGGGGGMFIGTDPGESSSAPSLTNVTFSNNVAERGGGLFNQNSDPILTNVIFKENSATNGAGGGMNSQTATNEDPPSNPVLINVTFIANTATGGGGMINSNSHAVMKNVTFSGNAALRRGGALLNEDSNPELTNVTFYNNTSVDDIVFANPRGGGGMMNINSDPILNNITFSVNDSVLIGGDAIRNVNSNPQIRNSIFWGDADDEISSDATSTITISDSVVEGGITGTNIITTDPVLGPLASNGGFTQTMALGVGSSAINQGGVVVGCAATDQRGVTRPQGEVCDIGAYEFDGATILSVSPVTDIYGNTVNLTAILQSYGTGLGGKVIEFSLNGSNVGTAVTNSSGVATLSSISLIGIQAGIYLGGTNSGVGASFTAVGDPIFKPNTDTNVLTVNQRPLSVTATGFDKEYDGKVAATVKLSDNRLTGDTLILTYANASFVDPNAGNDKPVNVIGIDISGGVDAGNYVLINTSTSTTATITKANQAISIVTSAPSTAVKGSQFSVIATASSGLPIAYSSSTPGVCTNSGATFTMISGAGTCTIRYNQVGDTNHLPAPELTEDVIAMEGPTISGKTGVNNVTLSYVDGTLQTITSDSNGNYSITVPLGWSGIITPSKDGYLFVPVSRSYSNLIASLTDQNFNIYRAPSADFNGDGKTDVAVFRPSNSTWYISGQGSFVYGQVGDIPVPADYNGDGKDEIAVFRPSNSTWYIYGVGAFTYGTVGDIPVVADYNGDGKADIAVFRPSNSTWYIYGVGPFVYGTVGDIPVVADYNGDGKDDIAVFRPTNSTWYLYGIGPFVYGTVGDIPVVGDYNGDGKADIAVFRPTNSTWYLYGIGPFMYGTVGDIPVVGDYNGDGKADIAVFRPMNSTWYIYKVGPSFYGTVGDIPV